MALPFEEELLDAAHLNVPYLQRRAINRSSLPRRFQDKLRKACGAGNMKLEFVVRAHAVTSKKRCKTAQTKNEKSLDHEDRGFLILTFNPPMWLATLELLSLQTDHLDQGVSDRRRNRSRDIAIPEVASVVDHEQHRQSQEAEDE